MTHIRKQVRDAAKTALTGLTSSGANVFSGRVAPLQASEMPGILVYLNLEDGQPDSFGAARRDGQLRIEGVRQGNATLIDDLDQMALEIETAIMADAGLLALLMGPPDPPTTTITIDEPSEGVAARTGSVVIVYPIQYRTPLGDPGTQA